MPSQTVADARAALVLALACAATALAIWLVPASVHVVGWDGDQVSMVSLLPPVFRLGLILGVTVAVAVVLGVVVHRRERLPQLARIVAPLTLLFFWALPFLPAVPEHVPLLLVLGGPVRWVVVAVACLGCVLVVVGERRAAPSLLWPAARAVFVTSLVLFIALGVHTKRVRGVEGDEPHYLVIAHSLLVDGDLRIENNHQAGHYEAFYSAFLAPHFLQRGVNDVIYSIHSPGFSALVLPFYAVAGQWGAMALIALLASLAAVAVFRLTERLTTRPVATITWVAVALTIPFAPQSWLVYPDMPAALGMAWAATWVLTPVPTRPWTWVWRGAALGVLPWLHVRYSLLLVGITVCLLVRLWPRRRLAGGFLAPMAVSGALWLLSFYVMYGTPNPTMPYGYDGAGLDLSNIPRGVLGLLFDQEFGLLTYSPIYVMAGLGAWLMLRREETRGADRRSNPGDYRLDRGVANVCPTRLARSAVRSIEMVTGGCHSLRRGVGRGTQARDAQTGVLERGHLPGLLRHRWERLAHLRLGRPAGGLGAEGPIQPDSRVRWRPTARVRLSATADAE